MRGLRVKGQLTLNEIISDSPLLRYAGARDSISADVDWDLSARELLRAQGALWRLHEREVFGAAGTIAWGGGAEAQLGHRLRLRRPALSLLATGSFAQNRLSTGFVPAIIRGALGEPSAPAGVDPPNLARLFVGERFAQVGASAAAALIAALRERRPGLRLTVDTEEDLAFMQKLLEAIGPANFPAPLSAFIDVADRLTWMSNGSGTTRRGMR